MRSLVIGTALPRHEVDAVVVVDVIRAMTTAVTAVALGRRCLPVPSLEAAHAVGRTLHRPLYAGELRGMQPLTFELGNSPTALCARTDLERPLILLSSSGTRLLGRVRDAGEVYAGCLRNARALATHLAHHHKRVAILGAPTRGQFREEDQLGCARIAGALVRASFQVEDSATAELIERWWNAPTDAIMTSDSAQWLLETGQEADLEFIRHHVDDLDLVALMYGDDLVATTERLAVAGWT